MHRLTGSLGLRSLMIASVVLIGGCSDPPEKAGRVPAGTPSSNSAPSPTATPVEAQVEAAVRAYYAELARAVRTGETGGLKERVRRSCPCYGSVRSIDRLASKNQSAPKAHIEVSSINVHDVIARSAGAEVSYDVPSYDLVERNGTVVSHIPARRDHVDLSLVSDGGAWMITNVFNLE